MDYLPIGSPDYRRRYIRSSGHYSIPFNFTISHQVLPNYQSPSDAFLQLPPSLAEGRQFVDAESGKLYMQPLVLYTVNARLIFRPLGSRRFCRVAVGNEFRILPRLGVQPPFAIDDFPSDFQATSQREIQLRSPWRRVMGTMRMSTKEPPPVILNSLTEKRISLCHVSINYSIVDYRSIAHALGRLSCRIKVQLRIKTYFATRSIRQVPDEQINPHSTSIRVHTDLFNLGDHNISLTNWTLMSQPDTPRSVSGPEWTSSFSLPITIYRDVVPTFIFQFAARLYALNLTITLSNFSHKPFEVQVPLQIVHEHTQVGSLSPSALGR